MIKGITSTGFKFEIEDDVLDDWNILKYLKKIDEGEIEYIIDVVQQRVQYDSEGYKLHR